MKITIPKLKVMLTTSRLIFLGIIIAISVSLITLYIKESIIKQIELVPVGVHTECVDGVLQIGNIGGMLINNTVFRIYYDENDSYTGLKTNPVSLNPMEYGTFYIMNDTDTKLEKGILYYLSAPNLPKASFKC